MLLRLQPCSILRIVPGAIDILSQSVPKSLVVQLGDVMHSALDSVLLEVCVNGASCRSFPIALFVDKVHVDIQDNNGQELDDVSNHLERGEVSVKSRDRCKYA